MTSAACAPRAPALISMDYRRLIRRSYPHPSSTLPISSPTTPCPENVSRASSHRTSRQPSYQWIGGGKQTFTRQQGSHQRLVIGPPHNPPDRVTALAEGGLGGSTPHLVVKYGADRCRSSFACARIGKAARTARCGRPSKSPRKTALTAKSALSW